MREVHACSPVMPARGSRKRQRSSRADSVTSHRHARAPGCMPAGSAVLYCAASACMHAHPLGCAQLRLNCGPSQGARQTCTWAMLLPPHACTANAYSALQLTGWSHSRVLHV
eukprot:jgi/Ulvmu1/8752/UM048_0006.1